MDSFDGIIEFVAVAQAQGFSAAAKQLGCSTSHVSRQVARLEQRLGCTLLARSTRLVTLTDSGAAYFQQAKDLVTGLQQANEQLNQQQVHLSGTLRVSAAGGFCRTFSGSGTDGVCRFISGSYRRSGSKQPGDQPAGRRH